MPDVNLVDNSKLDLNQCITMKDLEGNDIEVVRMYCTIDRNVGINYVIRVVKQSAFEQSKEDIQVLVNQFKAECEAKAIEYNVPII